MVVPPLWPMAVIAFLVLLIAGFSKVSRVSGLEELAINSSIEPICWETNASYDRGCFHTEPLTLDVYPLTTEILERAAAYPTTDLSIHRVFERARGSGVLKVVVVGGSVTYGHMCRSPAGRHGNGCAWPNRLQEWCEARIEEFTCDVVNAAIPAYDILDLLHNKLRSILPVDLEVDLVIVDYGVNDAVLEHFDFDKNNVKLAHEIFVRYVRNSMTNAPALLYAESFIPPKKVNAVPRQGTNMAEVHAEVTRKYDIPMVSFRHAVWPDLNDPALADRIWGQKVHPDWQVQQLLADVLVYYLQKSYARFLEEHGLLSNPTLEEQSLLRFKESLGCLADERSFRLDAGEYVGTEPPLELVESQGWSFTHDTRGEDGLIGFGNSSRETVISFDLPCAGERRLLDMGYLLSYRGMGAVNVSIDRHGSGGPATSVVIDALWKTHASVQDYTVVSIPDGADSIRVTFELLSAEREPSFGTLASGSVSLDEDEVRGDRKFKLVNMQCC